MLKSELYLNDIRRAIKRIENSIKDKTFNDFKQDYGLIDATSMRLQIIGESISKLPFQLKKKYPEIEWERYLQTRNIISHAYFAVNLELIWIIMTKEVPKLKKAILHILKTIKKYKK